VSLTERDKKYVHSFCGESEKAVHFVYLGLDESIILKEAYRRK
jgi:hypothetical protein